MWIRAYWTKTNKIDFELNFVRNGLLIEFNEQCAWHSQSTGQCGLNYNWNAVLLQNGRLVRLW